MVVTTGLAGRTATQGLETPSGTGSMPGTTAGRGVWTLSASRLNRNMTGLKVLLMEGSPISGHLEENATLMVVISQSSFQRILMAGSGQQTK